MSAPHDDPYRILGVDRGATDAAIRAAYRKLAKTHHPDLNPGKPEVEEQFKRISAAYGLLSDPDKRARYDRGEIDASGNEVPPQRAYYRDFGDRGKYRSGPGFEADDLDLDSVFARAFGDRFRGAGGVNLRGGDVHYSLTVDFVDAATGVTRRLTLPDGRALDVTVPAGLQDGQVLRLRGQGQPGFGDGPPGDALIEVSVAPDPVFRRDGNDILLTLPVTLTEAVLGARIDVPTIGGPVTVTVPAGSGTGTRLRLKGRGIAGGSQLIDLEVVVPPADEPELAAFLKGWQPRHAADPRRELERRPRRTR